MANHLCSTSTKFKNTTSISDSFLLNSLEVNMKLFLDWSFLCIGAWFDAKIGEDSFQGVNQHSQLVPVSDPSYVDGQVWQSIRKDWVWESGIDFKGTSPIPVLGIEVDGNYLANDGSQYSINYPEGKIIFDTPQAIGSNIRANYSYRNIQTYRASDSPWFNYLQYASFNTSNPDINRLEDGDWSIAGEHRIQLPAIVIESISRSRSYPYELGNNSIAIEQDVEFYVLAENKNDRNKILDILRLQQDLVFMLYDTDELAKNDAFPLDYKGSLKFSPKMYPTIVEDYPWRKAWMKNVSLFELESVNPEFHRGLVRATIEIIS
jgi:hypothetical protein